MIGAWLFSSVVEVQRPKPKMVDGILTSGWRVVAGLERLSCRLEVNFYRPGKDALAPVQAGRAPDRVAVYWVAPDTKLLPGDLLKCISGPITGTWQVRTSPDVAQNMRTAHHLEGQCVEMHSSIIHDRLAPTNPTSNIFSSGP